jgi:two-component system sensor histidine kinase AtoS
VEDSGCGIDPKDMERLFLPSFSTRTSGTGLGLFHSRKIAREHGGDITAISTPGRGSTFSVSLPLDDGRAVDPPPDAMTTETVEVPR